jgi:CHAT domain-containing protein/cytochrome c-type biogenesis protein CcmH/NrfG
MHRSAQSALSLRATIGPAPEGLNCLSEGEWVKAAAGLLEETEAKERMHHAAQCGQCGPLLKAATRSLSDETSPDEEAVLARLRSARPEWQSQMAGTLRTMERPPVSARAVTLRAMFRLLRPVYLVPGFAVLILLCWLAARFWLPVSSEQLLAQAYTQHRTLEARIPGAEYAPLRVERGSGASNLNKPPSLLEAEAIIAKNLQKDPNDPKWLQARARADLLDGNYDSAIKSLDRALERHPDSPQLLSDLGAAYFERGETGDRAIDDGRAIEYLSKALSVSPDDPVALFNRALAYERMFLYAQATTDWEHYLRVDPKGAWSDDVRKRLEAIRDKQKSARNLQSDSLSALIASDSEGDATFLEKVRARPEDYLEVAVRNWLPESLEDVRSSAAIGQSSRSRNALVVVAEETSKEHSDDWLRDFATLPPSPVSRRGIQLLADAIASDAGGNYDRGATQAHEADILLERSGSVAGALRAQLERVTALDRSVHGDLCARASSPLVTALRAHHYPSLMVRALIEDSTCLSVTGEMRRSLAETDEAVRLAHSSGYRTLYLKALVNATSFSSIKGAFSNAWNSNRSVLSEYWKSPTSDALAFQFYSELSYDAEGADLRWAALAAAREAVGAIISVHNRSVEALARYRLASLAQAVGADSEASVQFRAATQLFGELPPAPTNSAYQVAGNTMLASILAKHADFQQSLQLLRTSRPLLPAITNLTVPLQFYQTLGTVYLEENEFEESRRALQSAVSIGEAGLSTMNNARDRMDWQIQLAPSYRDLVKILFLHDLRPEEALQLWEWFRAIPLRSKSRQERVTAHIDFDSLDHERHLSYPDLIANVQPMLTSTTILSYAQMPDGVLVWVFDDRGTRSKWVPVSDLELDRQIVIFNRECADPNSGITTLRTDAQRLYGRLVAPVAADLDPSREIIIEGDGLIATLPFEALVDTTGVFFGSRFAITSSPGIGYMLALRPPLPFSNTLPSLVVGAPVTRELNGDGTLPIPDAVDEAQAIASTMPKAHVLLGEAATKDAVRTFLRGAQIFHFAGHGISGPDGVDLPLSSSQVPDSSENPASLDVVLQRESLQSSQLIVLSACSSAGNSGNNSDSLVRTLLSSGVPHVVASRWNVDSRITATLMTSFYEALFSGQSVAHSLRQSRTSLMMRPDTIHPYYWAAFGAYGRN